MKPIVCGMLLLSMIMFSNKAISQDSLPPLPPLIEDSGKVNENAGKIRFICPMHSHIVKDHEGKCPICGMDLVKRAISPDTAIGKQRSVSVSGAMQQSMALTTESVTRSTLWRFINTYGSVQFDETGLSHMHPRTSGWLEKLTIHSVGQRVKQGELLYEIYAPDLLVAQEDFLSLLASNNPSDSLLERGRRRLSLLGLDNELIEQLARTRKVFYSVPYYANQDGIVSALEVREGMYIEAQNRIMTLADLSTVWVIADVFEHQINWVEVGKSVELDLPALDLYSLTGKIEFIYPTLDPVTRTLQVRLALDNPNELLKPDMLANVRIYGGPVESINIPTQALIQTEKYNRVFVKTQKNTFVRKEVEVGIVTNGRAEIRHGLNIGDEVVTSGQFLLDAEASLNNFASDTDELKLHATHQH